MDGAGRGAALLPENLATALEMTAGAAGACNPLSVFLFNIMPAMRPLPPGVACQPNQRQRHARHGDPARQRRRRLHRCHRSGQHAGEGWHAHHSAAGRAPADLEVPQADAVIVALKSRSNPAREAVEMSLAALAWLQANGTRQFYFKYCSTFDSTDARQHRAGRRCPVRGSGRRSHRVQPGLPDQQAHRLQGLSVRGRRAAVGVRHAPPSPHADDRSLHWCACSSARPGTRSGWCSTRPW